MNRIHKNVALGNFGKKLVTVCKHNLGIDIDFEWVKGHSATFGNERADDLATRGEKKSQYTVMKFDRAHFSKHPDLITDTHLISKREAEGKKRFQDYKSSP